MRSDYTQAYINRGDILIKLNRTKEAQEVYERALLYDSSNPDIYYNVSIVQHNKSLQEIGANWICMDSTRCAISQWSKQKVQLHNGTIDSLGCNIGLQSYTRECKKIHLL